MRVVFPSIEQGLLRGSRCRETHGTLEADTTSWQIAEEQTEGQVLISHPRHGYRT